MDPAGCRAFQCFFSPLMVCIELLYERELPLSPNLLNGLMNSLLYCMNVYDLLDIYDYYLLDSMF
jgi:hypothetical protein